LKTFLVHRIPDTARPYKVPKNFLKKFFGRRAPELRQRVAAARAGFSGGSSEPVSHAEAGSFPADQLFAEIAHASDPGFRLNDANPPRHGPRKRAIHALL